MLLQELKKIWRPWIVLAALVLCYVLSPSVSNLGPTTSSIELAMTEAWVAQYGPTVSEQELAEIEATLPALYTKADSILAGLPEARKYGLENYQDFLNLQQRVWQDPSIQWEDEIHEDMRRIEGCMHSEETDYVGDRIQITETYVTLYGLVRESDPGRHQNFLPYLAMERTTWCVRQNTVLAVVFLCLLLGPAQTRDHLARMLPLQYASRRGRYVVRVQLAANFLTSLVVSAVLLILGAWRLFHVSGLAVFFPCRMESLNGWGDSVPNWTYGTWCAVLGLMHCALVLGLSGIVFLLSGKSRNYISMLLKVIPFFAVFYLFANRLIEGAFYHRSDLYKLTDIPYVEAVAAGIILLLPLAACAICFRKLRRTDILTP